ncbi:RagB/SusD family nutrient uptake outer membrane protein [Sphingobacterium sp. 2149]|uniref:RagB/SusD family nutrient uptake outer membrane protein n=1 Tax=Sphingobacterium sp. 2149 TaxID=2817763 RepID=UPI00286B3EB3|nr:RagB/SusD family nutrient uptake outer membrane protein [Sphingobacterium sp. 2149]
MKSYQSIAILVLLLTLYGCDKYLDIQPKGRTLLTTVTDYEQWLNDPSLAVGFGAPSGYTMLFSDLVDVVNIPTPATSPAHLMYLWERQFSSDLNSAPLLWGEHYAKINHYNTVLLGIDRATGGTAAAKKRLKAEALLGRALEYFYLLNEYAQPYDGTTAAQDLAVPFVTSNDVTQVVPPRSTSAEIFQHIVDDIQKAIPDLPIDNTKDRLKGSVAAAYSVLARAYFYTGDYQEARKYAELALSNTQAVMLNLNAALPSSDLVGIRQDVIYGRFVLGNLTASLDFMRSFAQGDMRVRRLFLSLDNNTYDVRGATLFVPALVSPTLQYVNTGTSVQEMKLMIAEHAARNNELRTALQQLDELRSNRIAPASYTAFASTDQEAVLEQVLLERQHELGFSGLRWFDMRRLDREGRMGTIYRYDATGKVIATLEPHSNRYTLQIPLQVLSFNPGMSQNPL